jgi:hypothetical protein
MDLQAPLGHLVQVDQTDLPVLPVQMDLQVLLDLVVQVDQTDLQVLLDLVVQVDQTDLQVLLDHPVLLEPPVVRGQVVHLEVLVRPV